MNSHTRRAVHFGDSEDILSTSFFYQEDGETSSSNSEEEEKKKEIQNRVMVALKADDVSMFKHLLVEISDLVGSYLDKPIPHLAAYHGAIKVLQEFVSKPVDSINAATADFEATTPLFWAIQQGHAEVAQWLLSNGAFHQPLNVYQDSAVYVAIKYKQYDMLKILKKHNCDCNIPNRDGDLPIMCVVRDGSVEGLEKLLDCGADMHAKDINGKSVTHALLSCDYPKRHLVLKTLLGCGYSNQIEDHQLVALILPVLKFDHKHFLLTLLPHITSVEIQQEVQEVAVEKGAVQCLIVLLKEVGLLLSMGFVVRNGSSEILDTVINNVPNKEIKEENLALIYECIQQCWRVGGYKARILGVTHHVIHTETERKVQLLLKHGQDIYKVGQDTQMSPMFFATKISMVCMVLWMMRAGVNPNELPDNKTPLTAALNGMFAYYLNVNMVKMAYLWTFYLPSHNDPAINSYLKKTNFLQTETQYYEVAASLSTDLAPLVRDLRNILIEKSTNVKSLSHLCRISVLLSLGLNAHEKIPRLPIPSRFKEYMYLRDLEEMCRSIDEHVQTDNNVRNPYQEEGSFCLCSSMQADVY